MPPTVISDPSVAVKPSSRFPAKSVRRLPSMSIVDFCDPQQLKLSAMLISATNPGALGSPSADARLTVVVSPPVFWPPSRIATLPVGRAGFE